MAGVAAVLCVLGAAFQVPGVCGASVLVLAGVAWWLLAAGGVVGPAPVPPSWLTAGTWALAALLVPLERALRRGDLLTLTARRR